MLEEEEDKRKMAKLSVADEGLRAMIEDFKGDFDTAFEEMRVEAKMSYRQFVRYGLIEKYFPFILNIIGSQAMSGLRARGMLGKATERMMLRFAETMPV